MLPEVCTYLHNMVSFVEPTEHQINIVDIAHALSMIPRFNGHTNTRYTVAQHCIAVSERVDPKYALAALLHDAHEAYTGDIVSPLKILLPELKQIEIRLNEAIFKNVGADITHLEQKQIWEVDWKMCVTEARHLCGNPAWAAQHEAYPDGVIDLRELSQPRIFKQYLDRFNELRHGA